jgi:hypothetical protein
MARKQRNNRPIRSAGYNYNSDWTPLLAGLSPAGMAASLAARSFFDQIESGRLQTGELRFARLDPRVGG